MSVGDGFCSSSAVTEIRNPGVQNPHWRPWHSRNARCTGVSVVASLHRPSTVVISLPAAWTPNIRHERTASPSTRIVQAPQTPCSQPRCVPVSPRSSRRVSASVLRASTRTRRGRPLTVRSTSTVFSAWVVVTSGTGRLLDGAGEGSGDQDGAHPGSVRGAGVDVAGRLEVGDGLRAGLGKVELGDGGAGERVLHRL